MVRTPDGKTHFVAEKVSIGQRGGQVKKITSRAILVRERIVNVLGQEEDVDTRILMESEAGPGGKEKVGSVSAQISTYNSGSVGGATYQGGGGSLPPLTPIHIPIQGVDQGMGVQSGYPGNSYSAPGAPGDSGGVSPPPMNMDMNGNMNSFDSNVDTGIPPMEQ